eukprot:GHVQ01003535.1.p1 GENE.GHVQ01003535.1~~GHVQ01003535.1.p1  ORF type:complete len:346 (+),score=66.47 GHVQ01003535.1:464-1501(+)
MYNRAHPYARVEGGGSYTGYENTQNTDPTAAAAASTIAGLFEDPSLEALQSRSLLLTGVTAEIAEIDITAACEPLAEIRQCTINRDKQTAVIEFFDLRHAERARQHLKDTPICGQPVVVAYTPTKPRSDDKRDLNMGTLYVRPQGADRAFVDPNSVEAYKMLFGQYGEIKKVSTNRKREAEKFVEYFDCRGSQKAQELLNGYNFNGVILEVQYAQQPSRTLNRDSRVSDLVRGPYRRPPQPQMVDSYGPQRGATAAYHQPQQWQYPPQAYAAPPAQYWTGYGTAWDYYGQQYHHQAAAAAAAAPQGAPQQAQYAQQQYAQQQSPSQLAAAAASYAAAMSAYTATK